MKPKFPISVAIATYNEEANIKKCLDAIYSWVGEIVVVDGSSTDKTQKLVKSYKNARLIPTTNKKNFHINKQMAIDECKEPWILQLDADEVVSESLKKEIIAITKLSPKTAKAGYWVNRSNYFLGSFLKKGGVYPDATIRLYQNGLGRLPCQSVHEQAEITGEVGQLKSDLLHFADPSFFRYLTRNNRYTTLIAEEMSKANLNPSLSMFISYFIFKPVYWFLSVFFRHKGFYDGFPGFVFAYFSSLRFPIAYIKFWEMYSTSRIANQTDDWDK